MVQNNINNIYKKDFPIFENKELIYLDSAATTQKPNSVINAISQYYKTYCASPHRGTYYLSEKSTELYDNARRKVAEFISAKNEKEILFTKNATESLNLIAYSYGMQNIAKDDEIVVSILEHHSNLVPWQEVAKKTGAKLKFMYIDEEGQIPKEEIKKITQKTKVVCITHVSNVLGTIVDIGPIIKQAHQNGAKVIVDGTQAVPHMKVDMQKIDADFYVFSAHKMLGPTGIGVLYAKESILEHMNPFLMGGDMIEYVSEQDTTFAEIPNKFEAGTQNVSGAVGLNAAIEYIEKIGYEKINKMEKELLSYAIEKLSELPYIEIYGPKDIDKRCGVIAFNVKDVHPHDVATILNDSGVCIRAGHHCAQPLGKFLGVSATCRISFYLYNDKNDVDQFIEAIKTVRKWILNESK
jgi:cysteine desulfurase/selenocysteine lyase